MTDPVVVQKFGGTSVGTPEGRSAVVARVRRARDSGRDVAVVVSAMGRAGSPYATDTLLALIGGAAPDDREHDMLAACGEVIAAVVLAHELRDAGVAARAFTGAQAGILTDDRHTAARVVGLDPTSLLAALDEGVVPVVAGFQGRGPDGEVTTLGRGGSDTTACALGVALGAEAVEIYTDVDGVMTADPRGCAEARVLDKVAYEELFQLAHHGAKVVHAPAAELAMDAGVPVRIRSTFSDAPGTLVAGEPADPSRVVTAISHVDGIAQVRVTLPDSADALASMQAQTQVYTAMAAADVSLDMFTPCGSVLVFTIEEGRLPDTMRALDLIAMPYEVSTTLSKVTVVGAGMRGVPGVMAAVARSLADASVPILQTADSHTTISVLVPRGRRRDAVTALHASFALDA